MSLALLLPTALAALAAWLLPLLIHLARRSEQRPTDFAALRWLRQKPRPRHRLRFDEWPLLLLRLLLLALLVLWLAKPVLQGSASDTPWVVVAPGVDPSTVPGGDTDARFEKRWLAPGFSPLDSPAPAATQPIASLLRELDADLPASVPLSVFVPRQLDGADAQRPLLSRPVEWRVLPGAALAAPTAPLPPPLPLHLRYAPEQEANLRYLRAAVASWQTGKQPGQFTAAPTDQPLPAHAGTLVWLAPGALPASIRQWITAGGTALLDTRTEFAAPAPMTPYWADAQGAPLVEGTALGQGRVLRFTRPLQPASMPQLLEPDFPRQLRALLSAPAPAPARVAAIDYAPITGAAAYPQAPRDLRPWLVLLLVLVLLLERWLATGRRRSAGP